MAIFQELIGQGRVVAGYMNRGDVVATKHGLALQLTLVRRQVTPETVKSWEELDVEAGLVQKAGGAAIGAVIPGALGRAVGASFNAAAQSGHTVRLDWENGKQSVIELPNKLFSVLLTLLRDKQILSEVTAVPEAPRMESPSVVEQALGLASSVLKKDREIEKPAAAGGSELMDQIARLSRLRDEGVLTDEEFQIKKTELLGRL